MKNVWTVKWCKVSGKYQQSRTFYVRHYAILFLNHLILDCSIIDAKLITEKRLA